MLAPESSPYMRFCPKCGALMPKTVKGCWNCGYVLDPRLIELTKPAKEEKP